MKIDLTDEQMNQILKDGFLSIQSNSGFGIYIEYGKDLNFEYGEINHSKQTKELGYESGFVFNEDDLKRLKPRKPTDPNFYHDEPLCPNCRAYMLYQFECCPKCGQVLDWRERT